MSRRTRSANGHARNDTAIRTGETMLRRLLVHAVDDDRKLDEIVGPQKPEFIRLLRKIADALT